MHCKSCLVDAPNELYLVKEMYLGLREVFDYQRCSNCGAMQLKNIPQDLGKYYPPDKYYSFNTSRKRKVKKDVLRKIKAGYILYGKNKALGSLLSIGYKIPAYFNWLKKAAVQFNDSILDVGCGDGGLLVSLYKNGFTNLTGIDPFNATNYDYGGVKILKEDIFRVNGEYDFIMLNHVFEHLDEPARILKRLYQLLKPQKYVLIRTPVMDNYSWRKYRENWMDLDAPRHLIIHTVKSMNLLAEKAGFIITETFFDGTANSLTGSEQYVKGVPLLHADSYFVNKESTLFTKAEIDDLKKISDKINNEQQGDQAAFFLYKP